MIDEEALDEQASAQALGNLLGLDEDGNSTLPPMDPEVCRRIAWHDETDRIAREEWDRSNGIRKRGAPKRRSRYRGTPPGGTPRLTEFSLAMARTVATIDGTVERWTGKAWQQV